MDIETPRGKGVAMRTIVLVAIGVGGLLFGFIMLTGIGDARENIIDILLGLGSSAKGPSKLEVAIECAYYRCKEGCPHGAENVEIIDGFECLKFCDEAVVNSVDSNGDKKICGSESRDYPVTISIEASYVHTNTIDDAGSELSSIVEFNEETVGCENFRPSYAYLYVTRSMIVDGKTEICPTRNMAYGGYNCYDNVKVAAGDYSIWVHNIYVLGVYVGTSPIVCMG